MKALLLIALLATACSSADVELGADAGDDAGTPAPVTACTAEDAANRAPCELPPGVGFCIAEGCCMDPGEGVDACPDGGAP